MKKRFILLLVLITSFIGVVEAEPYDLSEATYEGVSISTQDSTPTDIAWNDDGTKLYEIGVADDKIYEYDVNTPYDISTASYNGVSISTQDIFATGLAWNGDGTKLYEVGVGDDKIYEYDVNTPYDISTASYNGVSVATQGSESRGLAWNGDGTKLYKADDDNEKIYEYDLGTPYDISTASYNGVSISTQDSFPQGLAWNGDGTKLYEVGGAFGDYNIYEYDLGTPYDISTASYNGVSISTQDSSSSDIAWNNNGTKLYEVGNNIYEYDVGFSKPSLDITTNNSQTILVNKTSVEDLQLETSYDGVEYSNGSMISDDLEYSLSGGSPSEFSINNNGLLTVDGEIQRGTYTFDIVVTDTENGESTTQSFTFTVEYGESTDFSVPSNNTEINLYEEANNINFLFDTNITNNITTLNEEWVKSFSDSRTVHYSKGYLYAGSNNGVLRKIDSSGNTVWSKDYGARIVEIDTLHDNIYITTGDVVKKLNDDGSEVWSYTGHTDRVNSVEAKDGFVYTGSSDNTAKKLNSSTGNMVWDYTESDIVYSVDADKEGNVYLGTRSEKLIKLDSQGNFVWEYTGHSGTVWSIVVDNKQDPSIYTASIDNTVRKINSSGNMVWTNNDVADSYGISINDIGTHVYVGDGDDIVSKIRTSDGIREWEYTGHTNRVYDVAVDNKGFVYSTSLFDNTVRKITDKGFSLPLTYEIEHPFNIDNNGLISLQDFNTVNTGNYTTNVTVSEGYIESSKEFESSIVFEGFNADTPNNFSFRQDQDLYSLNKTVEITGIGTLNATTNSDLFSLERVNNTTFRYNTTRNLSFNDVGTYTFTNTFSDDQNTITRDQEINITTGILQWNQSLSALEDVVFRATTQSDMLKELYVIDGSTVRRLDSDNGIPLWSKNVGNNARHLETIQEPNDELNGVVVMGDNYVERINKDGSTVWGVNTGTSLGDDSGQYYQDQMGVNADTREVYLVGQTSIGDPFNVEVRSLTDGEILREYEVNGTTPNELQNEEPHLLRDVFVSPNSNNLVLTHHTGFLTVNGDTGESVHRELGYSSFVQADFDTKNDILWILNNDGLYSVDITNGNQLSSNTGVTETTSDSISVRPETGSGSSVRGVFFRNNRFYAFNDDSSVVLDEDIGVNPDKIIFGGRGINVEPLSYGYLTSGDTLYRHRYTDKKPSTDLSLSAFTETPINVTLGDSYSQRLNVYNDGLNSISTSVSSVNGLTLTPNKTIIVPRSTDSGLIGTQEVTFTASDGFSTDSVTTDFTVVNPEVNITSKPSKDLSVFGSDNFTFDVEAENNDVRSITYSLNNTDTIVINEDTGLIEFNDTVTTSTSTEETLLLTATDGFTTDEYVFNITVEKSTPEIVTKPQAQVVTQGQYSFNVTANTKIENNSIQSYVLNDTEFLAINESTGLIKSREGVNRSGIKNYELAVTDSEGLTSTTTFTHFYEDKDGFVPVDRCFMDEEGLFFEEDVTYRQISDVDATGLEPRTDSCFDVRNPESGKHDIVFDGNGYSIVGQNYGLINSYSSNYVDNGGSNFTMINVNATKTYIAYRHNIPLQKFSIINSTLTQHKIKPESFEVRSGETPVSGLYHDGWYQQIDRENGESITTLTPKSYSTDGGDTYPRTLGGLMLLQTFDELHMEGNSFEGRTIFSFMSGEPSSKMTVEDNEFTGLSIEAQDQRSDSTNDTYQAQPLLMTGIQGFSFLYRNDESMPRNVVFEGNTYSGETFNEEFAYSFRGDPPMSIFLERGETNLTPFGTSDSFLDSDSIIKQYWRYKYFGDQHTLRFVDTNENLVEGSVYLYPENYTKPSNEQGLNMSYNSNTGEDTFVLYDSLRSNPERVPSQDQDIEEYNVLFIPNDPALEQTQGNIKTENSVTTIEVGEKSFGGGGGSSTVESLDINVTPSQDTIIYDRGSVLNKEISLVNNEGRPLEVDVSVGEGTDNVIEPYISFAGDREATIQLEPSGSITSPTTFLTYTVQTPYEFEEGNYTAFFVFTDKDTNTRLTYEVDIIVERGLAESLRNWLNTPLYSSSEGVCEETTSNDTLSVTSTEGGDGEIRVNTCEDPTNPNSEGDGFIIRVGTLLFVLITGLIGSWLYSLT